MCELFQVIRFRHNLIFTETQDEKAVELLRKEGFSYTEIEDMFYEPGLLDVCLAEAGGGYLLAETY